MMTLLPNTAKSGRKKSADFLSQLLNMQPTGRHAHHNAQWSIQTNLNGPTINVVNFSDQHFWPVTFYKDQNPVGGAYIHPWLCGKSHGHMNLSLITSPITAFVTGMCLFGDSLIGLDAQGNSHPLTNPTYHLPQGALITSIIADTHFHPYEKLVQYNLINLSTLFKACSASHHTPILHFHLPIPEYLLYGVQWYLEGKISLHALEAYCKIIIAKGQQIKQFMHFFSSLENITVYANSPLDCLDIPEIIQDIQINDHKTLSVLKKIIDKLLSASGHEAIWQHALSSNPPQNIQDLSYLSYTVQVALASSIYGAEKICLIDEFSEMTIGRAYAKYFAEKWGTIKAMHWIPSVLPHDGADNSLYFCKDMKTPLSQTIVPSTLIKNGLLTSHCHPKTKSIPQATPTFSDVLHSSTAGLLFHSHKKDISNETSQDINCHKIRA